MARDRAQVIKPSLSLSHGLYKHGHRFKKHRLADPGTLGCASLLRMRIPHAHPSGRVQCWVISLKCGIAPHCQFCIPRL